MPTSYGGRGLAREAVRSVLGPLGYGSRMRRFTFRQRVYDTLPVGYFERRRAFVKRKWNTLEAFQNRVFACLIEHMENEGQIERLGNDGKADCVWEIKLTNLGWALWEEDEERRAKKGKRVNTLLSKRIKSATEVYKEELSNSV